MRRHHHPDAANEHSCLQVSLRRGEALPTISSELLDSRAALDLAYSYQEPSTLECGCVKKRHRVRFMNAGKLSLKIQEFPGTRARRLDEPPIPLFFFRFEFILKLASVFGPPSYFGALLFNLGFKHLGIGTGPLDLLFF